MYPEAILGTANFINPYGLNAKGLDKNDINHILQSAWDNDFRGIDTAADYINVQKVLAASENFKKNNWRLTTKIPKRKNKQPLRDYKETLQAFIEETRHMLGKEIIDTILVHDPTIFSNEQEKLLITEVLVTAREREHVKNIGFSVYETLVPSEMSNLYEEYNKLIIQCPFSIFDRRFEESINKFSFFCSFQARSIFLQGLLLQHDHYINKFKRSNELDNFKNWLEDNGLGAYEACVSFVKFSLAKELVIGFNSEREIEDFRTVFDNAKPIKPIVFCSDEKILNPLNW